MATDAEMLAWIAESGRQVETPTMPESDDPLAAWASEGSVEQPETSFEEWAGGRPPTPPTPTTAIFILSCISLLIFQGKSELKSIVTPI